MKATISFQVDFEDIPETLSDLIGLIVSNDIPLLSRKLENILDDIPDGLYSASMSQIDQTRQHLAKMDQKLLDYGNILAGFVKVDTDLKSGTKEKLSLTPDATHSQPLDTKDIKNKEKI